MSAYVGTFNLSLILINLLGTPQDLKNRADSLWAIFAVLVRDVREWSPAIL